MVRVCLFVEREKLVVLDGGYKDLACLRVEQVKTPSNLEQKAQLSSRRERRNESKWIRGHFIRGPIPVPWLERVCRLPGKNGLVVALAIWFLAGLKNQKYDLKLTTAILKKFGLTDRSAKSRALEALENGGLIRVERQSGKNPLVTILDDSEEAVLPRQNS